MPLFDKSDFEVRKRKTPPYHAKLAMAVFPLILYLTCLILEVGAESEFSYSFSAGRTICNNNVQVSSFESELKLKDHTILFLYPL